MTVHQLVHTLTYGDAISGEALTIKRLLAQDLLEQGGAPSKIYSVHAHEKVRHEVTDYRQFSGDLNGATSDTVVLLHYSIGSPLNNLLLSGAGYRKGLIFHNLTPEHWFDGYNPRVFKDLQQGRDELPGLLKKVDLLIADSEFNKQELQAFTAKQIEVLPLPLDTEKWQVPANPGIARAMAAHGGKNLLSVGRLAPNKCIEDVIKAFYFYHHKIEKRSRLWIVGSDIDTEIYSFELRRLVSELRLKEAVNFVGSVADSELKAFYQGADAYICMSEHEGFCVPLIEAMYFRVPIIAYSSTAVTDTLSEGGVLVKRKSPSEIAEVINMLLSDDNLRSALVERARKQLESFSLARFEKRLKEVLSPRSSSVVDSLRAKC